MSDRLTILISDMEGSTAYTVDQGDHKALDLIRTHDRITRTVVDRHGGREIKSMGDGFMVTFATPEAGVACALELVAALSEHSSGDPARPLHVRVGVHDGPVLEDAGDIYGIAVNAATRIAAKARRGQVLVSEEVRAVCVSNDCEFIDRGLYWLKGLRERWRLYEATRDPTAALEPATLAVRSSFVDREDERSTLRLYVDAALDGRGGLVFLCGEPGSGKTRLAEEIGNEASGRGLRLLSGRCYEATRAHPLGPFLDVLETVEREVGAERFREILGEAGGEMSRIIPNLRHRYSDLPREAELPPEQARRYLFTSLRDVFARASQPRPMLIHIDDLHWADEQTLLFLEQLASDLPSLPVLIVCTYPDGGPQDSPTLTAILDRLERRRSIEVITVGPLGRDDTASLVSSLVGSTPANEVVAVLHDAADGNPFFIEELTLHLINEGQLIDGHGQWRLLNADAIAVPDSVRLTIGRRVEALTSQTQLVLTTAAIVGRAFGFDLLEALAEPAEDALLDALDEAERARIITSVTDAGNVCFQFAHELIRQTLVASTSPARRQVLHLAVADALERLPSPVEERAADIAYHLVEAGRRALPERTVHFLLIASDQAIAAAAYEDALRHLEHALGLLRADQLAVRARILERTAAALRSLGRPDDAIARWSEACDAYSAIGDRQSVARLCLDAALQVSWWQNRPDTLALIDRGLEAAGDDTTARAGLLAMSAVISSHLGSYYEAEEKLVRALQLGRAQRNSRVLGIVLYTKAAHHFNYREHELVTEFGREAADNLREAGDLWNLTNVQGFVGQSLGFLGRYDEAAEATEGAKSLAERLGNWVAYVYIDRARAWRHISGSPDTDRLDQDGLRDVELGERLGYGWMCSLGYTRRSFAAFVRGDWEDALDLAEHSSTYERGVGHGHLGRLVLLNAYIGNAAAAIDAFERLRRFFPHGSDPAYAGAWDSFLAAVEGMAMIGQTDQVAALYPMVLGANTPQQIFRGWDYRLFATVRGIAATCREAWDDAEEHFREAVALADGLPYVLEQPEARRFYAWMLLRRGAEGDGDRATELLASAIEIYGRIGMPRHEQLARAMQADVK